MRTSKLAVVVLIGGLSIGCRPADDSSTIASPSAVTSAPAPTTAKAEVSQSQLLQRAEQAMIQEDWSTAKRTLTQLLLQNPSHASGLFLSAQLDAQQGSLDDAIQTLTEIPMENPQWGLAAMGQRAQWLTQLGRVNQARQVYELMLKHSPNQWMVRREYASMLHKVGWRGHALEVSLPLLQEGEASESELRMMLLPSEPYDTLLPPLAEGRTPRVHGPLSRAIAYLVAGQPRDAVELLQPLVHADPQDEHAAGMLAQAFAELQLFDSAQQVLAKAPESVNQQPSAWIARGDRWLDHQDVERAIAAYLCAFRLDTRHLLVHQRLASALTRRGDLDAARRIDDRYHRLRAVAKTVMAIGQGAPDDVRATKTLVEDLETIGEVEMAIAWLEKVNSRQLGLSDWKDWAANMRHQLQSLSDDEILNRQFGGINSKLFPSAQILLADEPKPAAALTKLLNQENAPEDAEFIDVAKGLGIEFQYRNGPSPKLKNLQIYEQLGGGLAALDYDLDGHVDLYLGQGGFDPTPPQKASAHHNALFRQTDGRFVEIGKRANVDDEGYSLGVTAGDWNQDGFVDLFVGNLGVNRLFINQGDGTFRSSLAETISTRSDFTTSVAMADVSGDGLPDLIEVNYVAGDEIYKPLQIGPDGNALHYSGPLTFRAAIDHVWVTQRNGGLKSFELGNATVDKTTSELGDAANPGLGVVVTDLDQTPGLEIFVANDLRPNQLWKLSYSDDDPTSLNAMDVAVARGCAFSSRGQANACMGVAAADFDGNATVDLLVTNWIDEWVNFFLQSDDGQFRDRAPAYRLDVLSEGVLGFGTQPIDFDHDGRVDVVIANGHIDDLTHLGEPQRMPTQLLVNCGDHFESAVQRNADYWDQLHIGRCVITLDHNRDGRVDIAVADLSEPTVLLENRTTTKNHWLQIQLAGVQSERDAIGAKVTVGLGDSNWTKVVTTGDGYQGRNEPLLTFGLGQESDEVSIRVVWPSGNESHYEAVSIDQRVLLIENDPQSVWQ